MQARLLFNMLSTKNTFDQENRDCRSIRFDARNDRHKTRSLLTELGCEWVIYVLGDPLQAGEGWVVERANS